MLMATKTRTSRRKASLGIKHPARGILGPAGIQSKVLFAAGFLAFSAAILVLAARILSPFIEALAWSAVLTLLIYPFYSFVLRITGSRRTISATISTLVVAAGVLGTTFYLSRALIRETRQAYDGMVESLGTQGSQTMIKRLTELPVKILPRSLDKASIHKVEAWVRDFGSSFLNSFNSDLSSWLNKAIGNLPMLLLNFFIVLVSVFFFLREGDKWFHGIRESVPLSPDVRNMVVDQFSITFRAIVYGVFLCAAIQGILMTIGFYLFRIPLPVLCGVLTFFAVVVPIIGPMAVWLPATLWLYLFAQDPQRAFWFFLYSSLIISILLDTIVTPIVIGTRAKLPVLFLFLSILGGIISFGALGLFLGPVLLAIAIALARIYRETAASRT